MLSQHLRSLRDYFDATTLGTGQMSRELAASFSEALGCAAQMAEGLEIAGVPPTQVDPFAAADRATAELIRQARLLSGVTNVVMLHADRQRGAQSDGGAA
jgi:hypothetical protein